MTQAKDKGMDFGKVFTMTLIMIAFSFLLIHLPTYMMIHPIIIERQGKLEALAESLLEDEAIERPRFEALMA